MASSKASDKNKTIKNWSKNITYKTRNLYKPTCLSELQEFIKSNYNSKKKQKLKVLGTKHTFNEIADTTDILISLSHFTKIHLNYSHGEVNSVTVGAGVTYSQLAPLLQLHALALQNLASLPHINIVGSICTGTHGSGVANGNLSSLVTEIEFIDCRGRLQNITNQSQDNYQRGLIVNLGAIGIVTCVTLRVIPSFHLKQCVYHNLSVQDLIPNFFKIMSCGYSVSLFTKWDLQDKIDSIWIKYSIKNHEFLDSIAIQAIQNVHPIPNCDAIHCTPQCNVQSVWYDTLPHFQMGFIPSFGEELQSEYFISIKSFKEAFLQLLKIDLSAYLLISEIRCIHSDELWMSPCYSSRDSKEIKVAFHYTWKMPQTKQEFVNLTTIITRIESILKNFDARPHWGKLFVSFTINDFQRLYPKLPDFCALVKEWDPQGVFCNDFLKRFVVRQDHNTRSKL